MFSELFDGEIVYSKRFSLSNEINQLAEAAAKKRQDADLPAALESFAAYMRESDEKCIYVLRTDKVEHCKRIIDDAKRFSDCYEVGIDIINYKFSYLIKLYIQFALFSGDYKEMLTGLMIAADEISLDEPTGDDYELSISLRCYTHDLYYDGRKKKMY